MDSRKCQTSTATPPEAGGLPWVARRGNSLKNARKKTETDVAREFRASIRFAIVNPRGPIRLRQLKRVTSAKLRVGQN